MNAWRALIPLALILVIGFAPFDWALPRAWRAASTAPFRVGSKAFTENIILGELIRLSARARGIEVAHQADIQGTQLVFNYLVNGSIDVYPEYTGTIRHEILADPGLETDEELRTALLDRFGIVMTRPLGFENTYAMGMLESRAEELNIRTISDLARHSGLKYSLSQEFVEREDGWQKMAATYGIHIPQPPGNDHALTYKQLETGAADVIDLYSTDAKIRTMEIRVLEDDLDYFPAYSAVFLYRKTLEDESPELVDVIRSFEGKVDNEGMIRMNALCEVDQLTEPEVAAGFLGQTWGLDVQTQRESVWDRIMRNTMEHVDLVRKSMAACLIVAIPLGVVAAKHAAIGQVVLGTIGVLQTVPGIALLVMLIAPIEWLGRQLGGREGLGASVIPVVVALFIYSLLPVVRNTYTGLTMIPANLKESADALGLDFYAKLWRIELPLALPAILSGIKTAAVINVGFACLGAMIGGGGYGQPIFAGVRLADTGLILQGAIPAAILALLVQGLFEIIERVVVPRGLRN